MRGRPSGTYVPGFARAQTLERFEDIANEWPEMDHPVRSSSDDESLEWQSCEILLMFEIPIHRDQCVDMSGGSARQLAVLEA